MATTGYTLMTPSSESIRVLHVDDEPDFADTSATFVEREDDRFDIQTATSASEGLDFLASDDFDCVVSDYDMPGQNGIEFLEAVRADYPDLPFILFTGKGSEDVASDAISAGVTDYLQKGSGTEQYELLANRVLNAVEQHRSQQRAAKLDRIRTLASDINQALVRAESRAEVETRVCEIISEAKPYLFAWIGEVDTETDRIEPRTWAGVEDDYLNDITITADESPTGQGPGGTAIRERRVAISQDITDDPDFEPWQEDARDRGFRAVAAVPLEYQASLYGELVVYAEKLNAFDEAERDLLAELGDDIVHALHSFEVQNRLRTERDRRQALVKNAPTPVLTGEIDPADDQHIITEVNDTFEDVFRYEAEEIIGQDVADVVVPENGADRHEEFRKRAVAGETVVSEVERITADGPRTFILTIVPFGADEEPADGWYAWYTDVTEHRERERVIEELHSTTNALMEATTSKEIAEITTDAAHDVLGLPANGVHLYDETEDGLVPAAWTAETEDLVGEPPTFAPGEGLAGTAFEMGEPQIYADISTVSDRFNSDTDVRSQIIFPLDEHGVLVIGSPNPDAFDEVDVSIADTLAAHATAALDRIEQERKLREERAFIDQALNTLDDLFYVIGPDGELRRWNDRLPEATDYTDEEITDMQTVEFFPEDDRERIAEAIEATLTTGYSSVEADLLTVHGERIPYEFKGGRLTDSDGEFAGIAGIGRDITTRKEREEELRRQRSLFEAILETSIDGILVVDENREYVTWNQQFLDMWRIPEEVVGDDPEEMGLEYIRDKLENPQEFIEKVEHLYEHPHEESRDEIQLADGRVFDRYSAPVETDDGTYLGRVWFFRDITGHKERERKLARHNERLEQFASVVSHDLRSPLNVAQGRIELARDQYDSENLDSAAQAVDRSLTLINDLLTLAREGESVSDVEAVDLAEICENCWQTVETGDATLSIEADQTIRADRSRLQQLLENLMRNAIEHGGENVTITVGDLDDGFYVADDGPGIPEDEHEDVFEAGYSTTDEGTGFGLNIVNEIVEAHGWEITVGDSKDGGARFEITGVEFPDGRTSTCW
ncbi:MAG: PAS domain S-box-containing protein [Natronomonas sp.]|jgi:PAS domain S-box-containing protein